jgi:hypothetical protein
MRPCTLSARSPSGQLDVPGRVNELVDRRRELAQRLEDHEVDPLVGLLPDPGVRPESKDLDVPPVGVPDLPGGAVIDLGAVANSHDGVGFRQGREVELKDSRRPPRPPTAGVPRCGR